MWQYYGQLEGQDGVDEFVADLTSSDLNRGIRGADVTAFALLEGEACPLFVRMALRAGAIFDEVDAQAIRDRCTEDIAAKGRAENPGSKTVVVSNSNALAVWLNYLLYHLSLTNPGREKAKLIDPDPFSLSLRALRRLAQDRSIDRIDRSRRPLNELDFRVALSFAGENRAYVATVAEKLRSVLGLDKVFYDQDYQAQLAQPNMDLLLQNVYRNQSRLVVVFLCSHYADKEWCGLEWRVVRELIKHKLDKQIMFVRLDDGDVDGLLSIDGYVDARSLLPADVADLVLQRVEPETAR